MKRDAYSCDNAGCKQLALSYDNVARLFVKVGRAMDASGDTDDVYQEADLCLKCLKSLVEIMMADITTDRRRQYLNSFTAYRRQTSRD
jgi:hypothetical protein